MTQASVAASAVIRAPASKVYAILANYREHHPHIVPQEYFRKIEVEEGGPEPGRVLEEVDLDGFSTTTFVVDPTDNGASATVSIQTTFAVRPGLLGAIERFFTASVLRRIYAKELVRLNTYAGTLP